MYIDVVWIVIKSVCTLSFVEKKCGEWGGKNIIYKANREEENIKEEEEVEKEKQKQK